jgi:hypothetical protein
MIIIIHTHITNKLSRSLSRSCSRALFLSLARALSLMDRYMSKPVNLQDMKALLGDLKDGRLKSKYGSK